MTPEARGDLAESLVPVAAEFAFLVRDEGREAIGDWLTARGITDDKARALLVVLAAMVNASATTEEMLEWVTWDEHGRPLEQTIPLLPVMSAPRNEPPAAPAAKTKPAPGPTPEQRLARFAKHRARGLSVAEAAKRMGVVKRTGERYEAKLRKIAATEESRDAAA